MTFSLVSTISLFTTTSTSSSSDGTHHVTSNQASLIRKQNSKTISIAEGLSITTCAIVSFVALAYRSDFAKQKFLQPLLSKSTAGISAELVITTLILILQTFITIVIVLPTHGLALYGSRILNANLYWSSVLNLGLSFLLWGDLVSNLIVHCTFSGKAATASIPDANVNVDMLKDGHTPLARQLLQHQSRALLQQQQRSRHLQWIVSVLNSTLLILFNTSISSGTLCQGPILAQTQLCQRCLIGIVVGSIILILGFFHFSWVGLSIRAGNNLAKQTIDTYLPGALSILAFISNALNVGFATSPGGPGAEYYNIFVVSWASLAISYFMLVATLDEHIKRKACFYGNMYDMRYASMNWKKKEECRSKRESSGDTLTTGVSDDEEELSAEDDDGAFIESESAIERRQQFLQQKIQKHRSQNFLYKSVPDNFRRSGSDPMGVSSNQVKKSAPKTASGAHQYCTTFVPAPAAVDEVLRKSGVMPDSRMPVEPSENTAKVEKLEAQGDHRDHDHAKKRPSRYIHNSQRQHRQQRPGEDPQARSGPPLKPSFGSVWKEPKEISKEQQPMKMQNPSHAVFESQKINKKSKSPDYKSNSGIPVRRAKSHGSGGSNPRDSCKYAMYSRSSVFNKHPSDGLKSSTDDYNRKESLGSAAAFLDTDIEESVQARTGLRNSQKLNFGDFLKSSVRTEDGAAADFVAIISEAEISHDLNSPIQQSCHAHQQASDNGVNNMQSQEFHLSSRSIGSSSRHSRYAGSVTSKKSKKSNRETSSSSVAKSVSSNHSKKSASSRVTNGTSNAKLDPITAPSLASKSQKRSIKQKSSDRPSQDRDSTFSQGPSTVSYCSANTESHATASTNKNRDPNEDPHFHSIRTLSPTSENVNEDESNSSPVISLSSKQDDVSEVTFPHPTNGLEKIINDDKSNDITCYEDEDDRSKSIAVSRATIAKNESRCESSATGGSSKLGKFSSLYSQGGFSDDYSKGGILFSC